MAGNGAKVTMESLQRVKTGCTDFDQGIEAAIGDLKSALSNVGGSWKDPDFATLSEKTEALEQAVANAQRVVREELLPFVESRISILGNK